MYFISLNIKISYKYILNECQNLAIMKQLKGWTSLWSSCYNSLDNRYFYAVNKIWKSKISVLKYDTLQSFLGQNYVPKKWILEVNAPGKTLFYPQLLLCETSVHVKAEVEETSPRRAKTNLRQIKTNSWRDKKIHFLGTYFCPKKLCKD